MKDVW